MARQLGAASLGHAIADVLSWCRDNSSRRVQRRDLTVDTLGGNREPDRFGPQRQDDRAADGDAGRDANAVQAFHGSSPNPVSMS